MENLSTGEMDVSNTEDPRVVFSMMVKTIYESGANNIEVKFNKNDGSTLVLVVNIAEKK